MKTANAVATIAEGNCLEGLRTLESNSTKLIITSPPYNIGKRYERVRKMHEYFEDMQPIIDELVRVLSAEGSLCWQVGNHVKNGEVIPLDILYYPIFAEAGLRLRNRIVWSFGHGLHASKRFSGRYETLLWFTKGDKYTFNLDDVRTPSKYPGKRHFKGDKKGTPSGNPLGKNPSDVWSILKKEWEDSFWNIPNVKANHPEKTNHPCQFPVELAERCVLALTNEDDLVLDPFAGTGSALIAALKHNRNAMGYELDAAYVELCRDRLNSFVNGSFKSRPLAKPIHVPNGRESVSQIPLEWAKAHQIKEVYADRGGVLS